jgi:hypothetical protein
MDRPQGIALGLLLSDSAQCLLSCRSSRDEHSRLMRLTAGCAFNRFRVGGRSHVSHLRFDSSKHQFAGVLTAAVRSISLQNLFTSSRASFLRVAYHSEIVRLLSLTFARTASSIPFGPFQQRTFVELRNCCSLESFSRWTINLASCRHTAGFVL